MLPSKYSLKHNNYERYIWLCGIVIAVLMGCRNIYIGSGDTHNYYWKFVVAKSQLTFDDYADRMFLDEGFWMSERGFYWFVWQLAQIFDDGQILIFVTSVYITWTTCIFIRNNSEDIPLSLLIYVCLGLFTFNMNGMRQAMAMSTCLLAYEAAKKRKLIFFALLVILAMQFHKTAICFAPMYFVPKVKNTKNNIILFIIAGVIMLFFMDSIILTYNDLSGEDYATQAAVSGGGVFVVLLYLIGLGLTLLQPDNLKDKNMAIWFCGTAVGLMSYVARYFSNQMLERISYYYFYFVILLIPAAINRLSEKEIQLVKWLFIVFAIALFAYRVWNGGFRDFTLFFL